MAYNMMNSNTVSKRTLTGLKDVRLHSFMNLETIRN